MPTAMLIFLADAPAGSAKSVRTTASRAIRVFRGMRKDVLLCGVGADSKNPAQPVELRGLTRLPDGSLLTRRQAQSYGPVLLRASGEALVVGRNCTLAAPFEADR